jgi:hypothetical protein
MESNVNENSLPWIVQRKHDTLKRNLFEKVELLEERINQQEQRFQREQRNQEQQLQLQYQQLQQQYQQLQQQYQQLQQQYQQQQLQPQLQVQKMSSIQNSQVKHYEVPETQRFFKQQQDHFMQELIMMQKEPELSRI